MRSQLIRNVAAVVVLSALWTAPMALGQTRQGVIERLDFDGGTMGSFVERVREGVGQPLNVLFRNKAKETQVPEVHFLNVHFESAIESVVAGTTLQFKRVGNTLGAPVYVISDGQASPFTRAPLPPLKVEVVSVSAIVRDGTRKIDAVLEAIDMALSSETPPERRARIQFHEASGLLIVQGTRSQIDTALSVVSRMTEDREAQRLDDLQRESERIRLEAEVAQLEAELEIAMGERSLAQLEFEGITKDFKQGMSSGREIPRAQQVMATMATQMGMVKARLDAARAQYELYNRAYQSDLTTTAERTTTAYDLGKASRAGDLVVEALAAIGRLQGSRIEVSLTGDRLTVRATVAQHEAIEAVVNALRAAAH